MREGRRAREILIGSAAYAACFIAVTWSFVHGDALPIHDADGFFAPFYMFVADLARQGKLLTWNPYTSLGSPDFADPQTGAFDPIVLTFGLLTGPSVAGFIAYWLSMWSLAGLGVLALSRRFGVPLWPAIACALAFVFCGFFVGHGQHTSFVRSLALLPLVLARLDVSLERFQARPACEAGVLFGLAGLAGYPGVFLLDGLVVGFWIVARLFLLRPAEPGPTAADDLRVPCERLASPSRAACIGTLKSALLFGACALVMLFPTYFAIFYEAAGYTSRSGPLEREVAVESNALAREALSTFASPWLAGPAFAPLWPTTDISSCSVYLSGCVVLLALFALCARPGSIFRLSLAASALLCVGAALGTSLPLRGWLYDLLPPLRYFRHASVFRGPAIFFVLALALLGARDLFGPEPIARRVRITLSYGCGALALIFVAGRTLSATAAAAQLAVPDAVWGQFATAWLLPALLIGLVSFWSADSQLRRFGGYALFALSLPDAYTAFDHGGPTLGYVKAVTGAQWESLQEKRVASLDLLEAGGFARELSTTAAPDLGPGLTSKNLLLRRPFLHGYSVLTHEFHLSLLRHPALATPLLQPQRMYFSRDVAVLDGSQPDGQARFVARASGLATPPVVLHEPPAEGPTVPLESIAGAELAPIVPRVYRARRLSFDVTVPEDGFLLVTDRWARGWRATVNGRSERVHKANFILRAVRVQRGKNRVDFRYHIVGFPWFSNLTWALAAAVLLWRPLTYAYGRLRGAAWQSRTEQPAHPAFRF